jgi:hypothetical protein
MADISLGTFEVTALSQMNPGSLGNPGGGGTPPVPTSNIALVMLNPPAGAGPASLTVSGLPSAGASARFATTVTLGKNYEIIFREIVPVP